MAKTTNKPIIIFGQEGTASELYDYLTDDVEGFKSIDIVSIDDNIMGNPIIKSLLSDESEIWYIFGVVDNKWRDLARSQIGTNPFFKPFTYIHPKAAVAKSSTIGRGVYIGPNATIAPNSVIKDHGHININASIGHHSVVKSDALILPGSRVSGNCVIGERTLIGSNSVIYQGVKIGNDCAVDALSYVKKNVPDKHFAYGATAKTIRRIF